MIYIIICHRYVIQMAFQLIRHYFYCIYKAIGWKEIEIKAERHLSLEVVGESFLAFRSWDRAVHWFPRAAV